VPKFGEPALDRLLVVPGAGGFFDAAPGFGLLPGDALGVDPQQHVHAVARPLGDLGRGHPRVQPGGNGRMAQIVGTPGQQRRGLAGGEGGGSGLVEDLEVGAVVEDAAARSGEDAPVRAWRVVLQVLAEERDQLGMDGYRAGFAARSVLEFPALPGGSAAGPPGAAARLGVGQDELAPAMVGQAARLSRRRSTASPGRSAA
jgi:hypothetical protein